MKIRLFGLTRKTRNILRVGFRVALFNAFQVWVNPNNLIKATHQKHTLNILHSTSFSIMYSTTLSIDNSSYITNGVFFFFLQIFFLFTWSNILLMDLGPAQDNLGTTEKHKCDPLGKNYSKLTIVNISFLSLAFTKTKMRPSKKGRKWQLIDYAFFSTFLST